MKFCENFLLVQLIFVSIGVCILPIVVSVLLLSGEGNKDIPTADINLIHVNKALCLLPTLLLNYLTFF